MTTMRSKLQVASVLLLAISLAGCQGPCQKIEKITGPKLTTSGTVDFTTYVAAGTSISTGYQSGGIVNRHQIYSFPAWFARQIGMTVQLDGQGSFSFPAVSDSGINPLLQLRTLSPVYIEPAHTAGSPINTTFPTAYSNMAVPGAILYDFANTTRYGSGAFPLVARGSTPIQTQVLSRTPTFISFEFGANEVLGPATAGVSTQSVGTTPPEYKAMLTAAMNAINAGAPNAKIALFNVPNVTSIPFFTTFKPYGLNLNTGQVVTLVGLDPVHDLVLLTAKNLLASGTGIPAGVFTNYNPTTPGNGNPLPGAVVLTATEQSEIQGAIDQMNAAVDSVAQRPYIVKVDFHGLVGDIAANGYMIGSTKYTGAFITGGLFSLDGVHPTDLAHALVANAMIDAVNAKFGSAVPHVDLSGARTAWSGSARPATPEEGALEGMRVDGLDAVLRSLYPQFQH
jgi:hypothetical protein